MKSKEEIKSKLTAIANNRNITGEAAEVIIDLLTYSLYHEQVEITNTAKEMSLNDAGLINSKISLCCNYMYSVYRGLNPKIKLKVLPNSIINKSKFDQLYESNTFKIYADEPLSLVPSEEPVEITGIICHKDIIDISVPISEKNMYYVDLVDSIGGSPFSDLSEDIIVSIVPDSGNTESVNSTEYQTTRIFSDHCKSYGDDEKIFVLTIPDYGIRLFKKEHFDVNTTVNIKVLPYTTENDFNKSELSKIVIPGTVTLEYDEVTKDKYYLQPEIPRQSSDSLLYQANYAGRVNHEIQSNSDVAYLFNEVFIDVVDASTYEYVPEDNSINIYYILKENPRGNVDAAYFNENYVPYFISGDVNIIPASGFDIKLIVGVVAEDTLNMYDEVNKIVSKYNRQLGITLNLDLIRAEITKINNVKYIKDIDAVCYDIDPRTDTTHNYEDGCDSSMYYNITVALNFYKE